MHIYEGLCLYVAAGMVAFPFDPWMAERIDVLRGPASVLYGEGAGLCLYVAAGTVTFPFDPWMAERIDGSDDVVREDCGGMRRGRIRSLLYIDRAVLLRDRHRSCRISRHQLSAVNRRHAGLCLGAGNDTDESVLMQCRRR
jgi:hypothetical protein